MENESKESKSEASARGAAMELSGLEETLAKTEAQMEALLLEMEQAEKKRDLLQSQAAAERARLKELQRIERDKQQVHLMEMSKTAPASTLMGLLGQYASRGGEKLSAAESLWIMEMAKRLATLGESVERCDLGTGEPDALLKMLRARCGSRMAELMDLGAISWATWAAHADNSAPTGNRPGAGYVGAVILWGASTTTGSAGEHLIRKALRSSSWRSRPQPFLSKASELHRFAAGSPAQREELLTAIVAFGERLAASTLGAGAFIAPSEAREASRLAEAMLGPEDGRKAMAPLVAAAEVRQDIEKRIAPWLAAARGAIAVDGTEAMEHILGKAMEIHPHALAAWNEKLEAGLVAEAAISFSYGCVDKLLEMGAPVRVVFRKNKPVRASSPIEALREAAISGDGRAKDACHKVMERIKAGAIEKDKDCDLESLDKWLKIILVNDALNENDDKKRSAVESFVLDQTMRLAGALPAAPGKSQRL